MSYPTENTLRLHYKYRLVNCIYVNEGFILEIARNASM